MRAQLLRYRGWFALIAAVIAVGLLSALSSGQSQTFPSLSVRDASPQGALGLYLWLGRIGYKVETETNSDLGLQQLQPQRDTFVVIAAGTEVSRQQTAEILRWVRAGGRLVLVTQGETAFQLLAALGVTVDAAYPSSVQVVQPLLLAPPMARLDGGASFVMGGSVDGAVAAVTPSGPVLLRRSEGLGQVWLLTAPELLANQRIAHAENRRLLLNLVGPAGVTVRFDEAQPPPAAPASTDWLTQTAWGIAFLFALAILVLYRGLSGVRLGPPVAPLLSSTRPATEYVVSMAGLLRRAHRRADVLRRYQQALRRTIAERTGSSDNLSALDDDTQTGVKRLLATPSELTEDELLRRAADIVQCEEELRRTRV